MKKLFALPVAVLALLVAGTATSTAAEPPEALAACADIVEVDLGYTQAGVVGANLLSFTNGLSPRCRAITYTLYVVVDDFTVVNNVGVLDADAEPLTFTSRTHGTFDFETGAVELVSDPIADDDATVCVYLTASIGQTVFDRIPDEGCAPLLRGGTGGGTLYD